MESIEKSLSNFEQAFAQHNERVQQLLQQVATLTGQGDYMPSVAVLGLLNSGKSTLLNAITKSNDQSRFKAADVRETTKIQAEVVDGIRYYDTPGLDATLSDDDEAYAGLQRADCVLFVHQPIGELDKAEIDELIRLRERFGDKFNKHVIMVITKIDKREDDNIDDIAARMHEQLEELGVKPQIIATCSNRFFTGVNKGKDALVKKSHINELGDIIADVLKVAGSFSVDSLMEQINEELNQNIPQLWQQREDIANNIKADINQRFEGSAGYAKQFDDTASKANNLYDDYKEKLEESKSIWL